MPYEEGKENSHQDNDPSEQSHPSSPHTTNSRIDLFAQGEYESS